jgi:hypothetical protein
MRLAAGGAPVAVKRRGVNQSTKVRTSLYMSTYSKSFGLSGGRDTHEWRTLDFVAKSSDELVHAHYNFSPALPYKVQLSLCLTN